MYHSDTLNLLRLDPTFLPFDITLVEEKERSMGLTLPGAVREWYSLVPTLVNSLNDQIMFVSLSELGNPIENWYESGPLDGLKKGLLFVAAEAQGVCNWLVVLGDSGDPVVLVEPESGSRNWREYTEKFSTFVYTVAWDGLYQKSEPKCRLSAQDKSVSRVDLELLRKGFIEGTTTRWWPGKTNYRFSKGDKHVLIWDNETDEADWFIWADSKESLSELANTVIQCGELRKTLGRYDPWGEEIISQFVR